MPTFCLFIKMSHSWQCRFRVHSHLAIAELKAKRFSDVCCECELYTDIYTKNLQAPGLGRNIIREQDHESMKYLH